MTGAAARAALVAAAVTLAACTGGGGTGPAPSLGARTTYPEGLTDAPARTEVVASTEASRYRFERVPIGAGGFVTGIVTSGAARYARTDVGGAYRWDGPSSRWVQMLGVGALPANDALLQPDYSVESIAVAASDPNTVLLAAGGDGNPEDGEPFPTEGRILISRDGGRTFTPSSQRFFISGNQEHRTGGERLAIAPTDADVVLLGTRREGLWRSADRGTTWQQIPQAAVPVGRSEGSDRAGVTWVTFVPSRPEVALTGVAGEGVYRSDDAGRSWRRVRQVDDGIVPQHPTFDGGRLLVGLNDTRGAGRAVLAAYDIARDTWATITPDASGAGWAPAADPRTPGLVVTAVDAVRDGQLWVSRDGGARWTQLEIDVVSPDIPWLARTDLDEFMSVGNLVFDGTEPGRLWFAEGMGVWRADDVGAAADRKALEFTADSVGIEETVSTGFTMNGDDQAITLVADRQGFLQSAPGRYPARTLVDPGFASGADVDAVAVDRNHLVWIGAQTNRYYSSDRQARGAVSTDGGRSWTELPNLRPEMYGGEVAVSATDLDNIVWLPTHGGHPWEYQDDPRGVYVTTDRGQHWKHLDDVGGSNTFHRLFWWLGKQALTADSVDGGVFYLVDQDASMYVSDDGGMTWDRAAHGPPCREDNACHVFGQVRSVPGRAGSLWASVGSGGLYRSDDRGSSAWQRVPGVDEVRAFDFGAPMNDGGPPAVYLWGRVDGDDALGLWSSADGGATWRLIDHHPFGSYDAVNVVGGDRARPGVVYVGFSGTGFVVGSPDPSLATPRR